jgi:hypothetical protein
MGLMAGQIHEKSILSVLDLWSLFREEMEPETKGCLLAVRYGYKTHNPICHHGTKRRGRAVNTPTS